MPDADPLRMYLVLRRGAVDDLARAGELAGAAAVACLRTFGDDPAFADAIGLWRPRPGKVCLRARTASQWRQARAEPHALAGDPDGEAVLAFPPRRRPLELGSSRSLQPGAAAIAIGSPFGLEGTVTSGIISAMGREIQAPNGFSISGVVQTDAAINPGNSGGPLLDGNGRVIGVNSQIASNSGSNSGVGFAVPIDTVKQVVPELKSDGKFERAWLGVQSSETTQRDGATVQTVTPSGPADDADLRRGDKIVELGGKAIRTPEDLSTAVGDRKPGDKVDVVVERDGDRETLNVTLGTRPDQPPQS